MFDHPFGRLYTEFDSVASHNDGNLEHFLDGWRFRTLPDRYSEGFKIKSPMHLLITGLSAHKPGRCLSYEVVSCSISNAPISD